MAQSASSPCKAQGFGGRPKEIRSTTASPTTTAQSASAQSSPSRFRGDIHRSLASLPPVSLVLGLALLGEVVRDGRRQALLLDDLAVLGQL